jgi:hypothetical protein
MLALAFVGFIFLSGFLLAAFPNMYVRFRDRVLWGLMPRELITPEQREVTRESRIAGGIIAAVAAYMAFSIIQLMLR